MRLPAVLAGLLAATAGLAGCSDGPEARLLEAGPDSGYTDEGPAPWVVVLADAGAWQAFWREHRSNAVGTEPPAAPEVEFASKAVVAIVAGTKPTGGWSIEAELSWDDGGRLEVDATVGRPGRGCVATGAQTNPYAFYVAPRTFDLTAPPAVDVHEDVRDCA